MSETLSAYRYTQNMVARGYQAGRVKTQAEWIEVWLKKFDAVAALHKVQPEKRYVLRGFIELFLWKNPGSPYYFSQKVVRSFLAQTGTPGNDALCFFYHHIAVSKIHTKLLDEINSPAAGRVETVSKQDICTTPVQSVQIVDTSKNVRESSPVDYKKPAVSATTTDEMCSHEFSCKQPEASPQEKPRSHLAIAMEDNERAVLLDKLKQYISVRNYSTCTYSSYMSAVARFLNWLTPESSVDWADSFRRYLIYLRQEQNLAANTVNQHAASINYFIREVLDLEPGDDILIRMKTDKALPRVHSQEAISRIINCPGNFKHRLLLMITYGCGLRLGEVQTLKLQDIDLERQVLWVRKGKGNNHQLLPSCHG